MTVSDEPGQLLKPPGAKAYRIGLRLRMFEFFGVGPEILVPDHIRTGITAAHRNAPDPNPTYQELAMPLWRNSAVSLSS